MLGCSDRNKKPLVAMPVAIYAKKLALSTGTSDIKHSSTNSLSGHIGQVGFVRGCNFELSCYGQK